METQIRQDGLPDGWRAQDLGIEQVLLTKHHDSELFFWQIDNRAVKAFDREVGHSKQLVVSFARNMAWLQSLEVLKSLHIHQANTTKIETV